MPSNLDHANHPFRRSNAPVVVVAIATVVSSLWVTFWSFITALGSGLASTPESPVPHVSNVLWTISGFAFIACFVALLATVITRRRVFGYILGAVVLGAGLALAAGHIVTWKANQPSRSILDSIDWPTFIVPLFASGVIFWKSRGLLPWGPLPVPE